MTIYRAFLMMAMVCLTACAGGPAKSDLIYYDLGAATEVLPTPLRGLDVVPSSWLASNAMYYRLVYVDGNRREHFANTRWTAQPAELLGVRLHQSLIANAEKTALTCRMRIELDDFVQVFDSAASSQLLLEGRATLYGAQQLVLARKSLRVQVPAGANAQSAVAASSGMTTAVARELHEWVRQVCK